MTVPTGDKAAICDLLVSQSHSIVLTLVLMLLPALVLNQYNTDTGTDTVSIIGADTDTDLCW